MKKLIFMFGYYDLHGLRCNCQGLLQNMIVMMMMVDGYDDESNDGALVIVTQC